MTKNFVPKTYMYGTTTITNEQSSSNVTCVQQMSQSNNMRLNQSYHTNSCYVCCANSSLSVCAIIVTIQIYANQR